MTWRLGTATALSIVLIGAGACADAPNTQRVTTTASTTTSSTAGSLIPPVSTWKPVDPSWFDRAQDEAALKRWQEAEAANARSSRSRTTTTTKAPARATSQGVDRSSGTQHAPSTASTPSSGPSDAFWLRLSKGCECREADGCPGSGGWFQFKGDTARKAGYVPGSSYEDQLAAAKRWLAAIDGKGGTTAGWPRCWWKAQE